MDTINLKEKIIIYILISTVCLIAVIIFNSRQDRIRCGYSIMYFVNLYFLHYIGALIYIFPWYWHKNISYTLVGFTETTYGILALTFGNIVISPILIGNNNKYIYSKINNIVLNDKIPYIIFIFGVFFTFILSAFIGRVATLTAFLSVGQNLLIVGLCLLCFQAYIKNNQRNISIYLILSLLFPIFTVVTRGFFGAGAFLTIILFIFISRFYIISKMFIIVSLIILFFGLSFYQSYSRDRPEIREQHLKGASNLEKLQKLKWTIFNPIWFNPRDSEQLDRLNERMNQNYLLGHSIISLNTTSLEYAKGETFLNAFKALVPRIIWKDKPFSAGGSDIVTKYTGIKFKSGTSVAVGQVMDLYINFGRLSVILGFFIIGILIGIIDYYSAINLFNKNYIGFVLWFFPGIALLNIEGSFAIILTTYVTSLILAVSLKKVPVNQLNLLFILMLAIIVVLLVQRYYLPLIINLI